MAITLKGFAQAFITNVSAIAKTNDPQLKLTPTGFLKLLLDNNATTEINNIEALRKGQDREIKLRYLQRGLESEVTDVDDCDAPLGVTWKESKITRTFFSKIGIFIPDDEFRQYEEEAIQTLAIGTPSAPLMRGLYEVLLTKLIPLLGKIDTNLVSAMATKWGANAAYGLSTSAQPIELHEKESFNDGYVKLNEDALVNEVNGGLVLCGNGLINRYDIYQRKKVGNDSQGFGSLPLNAYYDPRTIAAWGKDHFGAFAKDSVGFVDWNAYVGSFAGEKGNSVFFTIPVPAEIDGQLSTITFDCQLKYNDCPQYDNENQLVKGRGWDLIVSKHYGLFTAPTDAFKSGDVLEGVNGTFHYIATEQPITPESGSEASGSGEESASGSGSN